MRFVSVDGGIWKMSERNYRRMLKDAAENKGSFDANAYGKLIIDKVEFVSGWPVSQFQYELDNLSNSK